MTADPIGTNRNDGVVIIAPGRLSDVIATVRSAVGDGAARTTPLPDASAETDDGDRLLDGRGDAVLILDREAQQSLPAQVMVTRLVAEVGAAAARLIVVTIGDVDVATDSRLACRPRLHAPDGTISGSALATIRRDAPPSPIAPRNPTELPIHTPDAVEAARLIAEAHITLAAAQEHADDLIRRFDKAAVIAGDAAPRLALIAAVAAADQISALGDVADARRRAECVAAQADRLGDPHAAAWARSRGGWAALREGSFTDAVRIFADAVREFRRLGVSRAEALSLRGGAIAHLRLGDIGAAVGGLGRARDLYQAVGDIRGVALTCNDLGALHRRCGNPHIARELLVDARAHLLELGDEYGAAMTLGNLANLETVEGNAAAALAHYDEALPVLERLGDAGATARARFGIARNQLALGRTAEALAGFQRVLVAFSQIGDRVGIADSNHNVALALAELGDVVEARGHAQEALRIRTEIDSPAVEASYRLLAELTDRSDSTDSP
jgi:tetratricopeptide (TPR) repeat protein